MSGFELVVNPEPSHLEALSGGTTLRNECATFTPVRNVSRTSTRLVNALQVECVMTSMAIWIGRMAGRVAFEGENGHLKVISNTVDMVCSGRKKEIILGKVLLLWTLMG